MTINDIKNQLPIDNDRYFDNNCYVVLSTKFPLDTELTEFKVALSKIKQECFPDYKALSHALRAGCQIKEIFQTGDLAFPLKDAKLLRNIKQGKFDFEFVINKIEVMLDDIEHLSTKSNLPDTTDAERIQRFLLSIIKEHVYA